VTVSRRSLEASERKDVGDAVGDRGAGGFLGGEQSDDRDGLVAVGTVPDGRRCQGVDGSRGRRLRGRWKGSRVFAKPSLSTYSCECTIEYEVMCTTR
jgi:hypothetical protein